MTNEDVIKVLEGLKYPFPEYYKDVEVNEALDIAINAIETGEVYMNGEDYNVFLEGYKQGKKDFERPEGKWIEDREGYKCSICGRRIETEVFENPVTRYPFCHCGARMVGRESERVDDSKDFTDVVNDFISEQLYGVLYSDLTNEDTDE